MDQDRPTQMDGQRGQTPRRSLVHAGTTHTRGRRPTRTGYLSARDYRRALSERVRQSREMERVVTRPIVRETRTHTIQGHEEPTEEYHAEREPVRVGESSRGPRRRRGTFTVDSSTEDSMEGEDVEIEDPEMDALEARFLRQGPHSLTSPQLIGLFLEIVGRGFDGTEDPMTAGCWMISAHRTLFGLDCPEPIWTSIAVSALVGLARQWWIHTALASFAALSLDGTITWDMFCRVFRQRFLDAEECRARRLEFYYLRQGYTSVLTYTSLFDALLQFASPEMVYTEADRVTCFVQGLHGHIRMVMAGPEILTLADAVTWACRLEQDLGIHPWLRPPQRLWHGPRRP